MSRHLWAVRLTLHDRTHTLDHERHTTVDAAHDRATWLRSLLQRPDPGPGDVVAFDIVCLAVEEDQ